MFNRIHPLFGDLRKGLFAGLLVVFLVVASVPGQSSQAWASSKAPLADTLDTTLTTAAQEFVESMMDDYAEALEDMLDASLKPVKSAMKDLTKQLTKATAAGSESLETLAPKLTASEDALQLASTAFETLVADANRLKTALASAPTVLEETIQTQLGPKLDAMEQAFAGVTEAMSLMTADTAGLAAEPATAMASYTEHVTLLNQAIEAASMAVESLSD